MAFLPTETLARVRRAVRRGEYFHTTEVLLGLPILQPRTSNPNAPLFSITGIDGIFPEEQSVIGSLVLTPDALYREVGKQADCLALSSTTPLQFHIAELTLQTLRTSLIDIPVQTDNRIQAGSWPSCFVRLRQPHEQQRLVQLLQTWYEQRIPLKESYQGQRTFLLNPNMSYEEIQAFKQRYGVTLYN
ncbi:hypothetical protein [Hymenobacter sp. UYP22]|uniref:hypothetical protein n=1 Tax=Hymenobacter sp. UYP22 TaxID=3156348 RepID=UPI003397C9CC